MGMGSRRSLAWVAVMFVATACHATAKEAQPRPNLDLPVCPCSLSFVVAPEIPSDLKLYEERHVAAEVRDYRGALTRGFDAGVARFFRGSSGGADFTLEVRRAQLRFVPAAVNAVGGRVANRFVIDYQARLLDREGRVLARSVATVGAKAANTSETTHSMTLNLEDAIESMFERMSADFFPIPRELLPGQAPTPAAPAGPAVSR